MRRQPAARSGRGFGIGVAVAAAALAGLLGAAACGSDDDEGGPPVGPGGSGIGGTTSPGGGGTHSGGTTGSGGSGATSTAGSGGGGGTIVAGLCDADGVCDDFETCNTCVADCGSCAVADLVGQRAKYVDEQCPNAGDGLSDECAAAPGGAGRFNELQAALDSLVAGDTLYVYPGDYYRAAVQYANYIIPGSGAPGSPIVVTARFLDEMPILHSFNPSDPSEGAVALRTNPDAATEHVILDHLAFDGGVGVSGSHHVMQYLECWHGDGVCDGNWACLRIEGCTDCLAHHNHVHDVVDTDDFCAGSGFAVRETGLKEFSSTRTVWELNTIRSTVRWGYDLHRNSVDPVFRFNLVQHGGDGTAVHIDRSLRNHIYGNVIVHAGGCIDATMENEQTPAEIHADEIHHNSCVFSSMGITTDAAFASTIRDNLMHALAAGGTEAGNVNAAGPGHDIDYNGYDSLSYWHAGLYEEGVEYTTLAAWQSATGYDEHSIEGAGGPCTFVDPPADAGDMEFDLRVASGPCLSASSNGGELGAYGITSCVGHLCP